jgi:hypothetical protein
MALRRESWRPEVFSKEKKKKESKKKKENKKNRKDSQKYSVTFSLPFLRQIFNSLKLG